MINDECSLISLHASPQASIVALAIYPDRSRLLAGACCSSNSRLQLFAAICHLVVKPETSTFSVLKWHSHIGSSRTGVPMLTYLLGRRVIICHQQNLASHASFSSHGELHQFLKAMECPTAADANYTYSHRECQQDFYHLRRMSPLPMMGPVW